MATALTTYQPAVLYRVTIKATGQQFYALPSECQAGAYYQLQTQRGQITCTCKGFTRYHHCKHVAALAAHLNEKRAACIIRQAAQIASQADAWSAYQAARMDEAVYVPASKATGGKRWNAYPDAEAYY